MLDDSTDPHTRQLVDDHALLWQERGVAVDVVRRTNRAGYKAGALKEVGWQAASYPAGWQRPCAVLMAATGVQGLDILTDCDYVAIFDADFKPEPDFLVRTQLQRHPVIPCSRVQSSHSCGGTDADCALPH